MPASRRPCSPHCPNDWINWQNDDGTQLGGPSPHPKGECSHNPPHGVRHKKQAYLPRRPTRTRVTRSALKPHNQGDLGATSIIKVCGKLSREEQITQHNVACGRWRVDTHGICLGSLLKFGQIFAQRAHGACVARPRRPVRPLTTLWPESDPSNDPALPTTRWRLP